MSTQLTKLFENVLDRARASAAAYSAALHHTEGDEARAWLRQAADEQSQSVRLLAPQIESALGEHKPTWLAAALQAGKTTVARWQGHGAMLEALQSSDEALAQAYQALLQAKDLPVEITSMCRDQMACAEQRIQRLKQDAAYANKPESEKNRVTEAGQRGALVNTPKPVSAENSDC